MPWVVKAGDYYIDVKRRDRRVLCISDVSKATVYASVEEADAAIVSMKGVRSSLLFESVEITDPKKKLRKSFEELAEERDAYEESQRHVHEARRQAVTLVSWPLLRNGKKNPWYREDLVSRDENNNRILSDKAKKAIDEMAEKVLRGEIVYETTEDGFPNTPVYKCGASSGPLKHFKKKQNRVPAIVDHRERPNSRVFRKPIGSH